MIDPNRSSLIPSTLVGSNRDYSSPEVKKALLRDFYEKCYLCEDKLSFRLLEVDHREPRASNSGREFDWLNLYPCCSDCNKRRDRFLSRFTNRYPIGGLLFPGNGDQIYRKIEQVIVVDHPNIIIDFRPKESTPDEPTINTVNELMFIHNGSNNPSEKEELRIDALIIAIRTKLTELMETIAKYQYYLHLGGDASKIHEYKLKFQNMLLKGSHYSTLLRYYVKTNFPHLPLP